MFQPEGDLGIFLGGLGEERCWSLLRETIIGRQNPENTILLEIDPLGQKTRPDFEVTMRRLGIAVVDIRSIEVLGNRLRYRSVAGRLVPIHRIYNRTIADELIARNIQLPFDWTSTWNVEWAGHPYWYFLISKFSIPWLSAAGRSVVPPAVFLENFLQGDGRKVLTAAGVALPASPGAGAVYEQLLLKPLFSFAGKRILFEPSQQQLEAIDASQRPGFLLLQRIRFEPVIDTPHGPTQAEIRILYLWPDEGNLTPVLPLVRLSRGRMVGVDHNRNQEWVGASAAFYPAGPQDIQGALREPEKISKTFDESILMVTILKTLVPFCIPSKLIRVAETFEIACRTGAYDFREFGFSY